MGESPEVTASSEDVRTMDNDDLVKEFEKAQGIINGYGSILEKAFAVPYGAPVSLLPYTKEEIKKAIKIAVLILKKVEPDPQKTIEQLNICYVQLDRKSTRLNSSHMSESRMPSSA